MASQMAPRQDSLSNKMTMAFVDSTTYTSGQMKIQEDIKAELKQACDELDVVLVTVPFKKLDFGETEALDAFYNADVAVVDLTDRKLHLALRYRVGVRQSCGMTSNIVLFRSNNRDETLAMSKSCAGYCCSFFAYCVDSHGAVLVVDCASTFFGTMVDSAGADSKLNTSVRLLSRMKRTLLDVDKSTRNNRNNKIIADIRKARREHKEDTEALKKALQAMKNRIDDLHQCSPDVISNLLLAYRDIQDYDAMVKFVETLKTCGDMMPETGMEDNTDIQHQYAFALNRRNHKGDREKALHVIKSVIERMGSVQVPDAVCLCGRIYKDMFVDSDCEDKEALHEAIQWYRMAFEMQPNVYAGINLATMLVISGRAFATDVELRRIGTELNSQIGIKGHLKSLHDYWDVATYYEVCVLAEEYGKANEAADCMFRLQPPLWYLKSTLGNIDLIKRFRNPSPAIENKEEMQVFNFWMDFFKEAVRENSTSTVRFPVLVLEQTKVYSPNYVQINLQDEPSSIRLWPVQQSGLMNHGWLFNVQSIKKVSRYERNASAVLFYVMQNSDNFHIFFPSELQSARFYQMVCAMMLNANNGSHDSSIAGDTVDSQMQYTYDYDEKGNRVVLGKGSLGVVVAAQQTATQMKIAMKEIPEHKIDVQLLYEEIQFHSQLSHKNVVRYLGCVRESGSFKIFMEHVPGGSLTQLLRSKWGRLSYVTMALYTRQIAEGLKYLHNHQIVHGNLKCSNVMVNTYSGVVKVSDFGVSKVLSRDSTASDALISFYGNGLHIAPEVMCANGFIHQRRYGPPADIWALGCIALEMATGTQPIIQIPTSSAIFKVSTFARHPNIPEDFSITGKDFLKRCFEPDASKRATAADLLKLPFLLRQNNGGRRAVQKQSCVEELHRSVSAPIHISVSSPDAGYHKCAHEHRPKLKLFLNPPGCHVMSGGNASVPTPLGGDSVLSISSPMSHHSSRTPSIETTDCGSGSTALSNASSPLVFSPQRGDAQARVTLIDCLEGSCATLVDAWHAALDDPTLPAHTSRLTKSHLAHLLNAVCNFIKMQDNACIEKAISELTSELDLNDIAVRRQLISAAYHFHYEAGCLLRERNIQPHHIFALDNCLRSATQTLINVTQLQNATSAEDNSPSVAESERIILTPPLLSPAATNQTRTTLQLEYDALKNEHVKLLRELLEIEKVCQHVMKTAIDEKRLQTQTLAGLFSRSDQSVQIAAPSFVPASSTHATAAEMLSMQCPHQIGTTSEAVRLPPVDCQSSGERDLIMWLRNEAKADKETIACFLQEQYTLTDVLDHVTHDDLKRLPLRGGTQCHLWRTICRHRGISPTVSTASSPSLFPSQPLIS